VDVLGSKPVQPVLARIDAIDSRAALHREIARLAASGVSVPFVVTSWSNSERPDQVITGILPTGLGLPDRDYYVREDAKSRATRDRYVAHVATLFELSGQDSARAKAAAASVLAFETELAKAQLTRVERRNPYNVTNHVTPEKLREMTPALDWPVHFKALELSPGAVINVYDPKYMRQVDQQIASGSLDDWKTYLKWHVLRVRGDNLSQPFRDEIFDFNERYLGGATEAQPRWKMCVNRVDTMLGESLGRIYSERYFPPAAKARMQEMVKNIRLAMQDTINELPWMTQATRERALAKLASLEPQVGYPDRWRPYAGLKLGPQSHFENIEAAHRWNVRDRLSQIGKPVDRSRWAMTAPTSNAYYNATRREIVFPAGILIPPMFNLQADDAVNYGAIGVVIGHEISHGFDDQGSQYDSEGRLKNWWTPEDRKLFLEKAECVVDQFNNYFIEPGVAHNGKLVLGESIGDLAGAQIAYRAYLKSLQGKPEPAAIGGFTHEQRFFISWGQARGDSTRLETQRLMVVTDPHPVAKWRVNGPLSNMPEFYKAFGCKESDAMVRGEKRCQVW
jgi:endothelin-converting enzyme/putative endopeptidase